jgi:hypothetical protein
MTIAAMIDTAITISAHTDDSSPSAIPDRISVAGPVRAAVAHSVTGPLSGWVK